MRTALITVDPISAKEATYRNYCGLIQMFQSKGLFKRSLVVSAIHPSLFPTPTSWYEEMKSKLGREVYENLQRSCWGKIHYDAIKVLYSDTHDHESLVKQIARYGRRNNADVLVISSKSRRGLPHWILGSFAETASLTSSLPILILKPHVKSTDFSSEVRMMVSVDVSVPVSKTDLNWILKSAQTANAHIEWVYVEPNPVPLFESLQKAKEKPEAEKILSELRAATLKKGIKSSIKVLQERTSIAHTLANHADSRKVWLVVTLNAKRPKARHLWLGSTARRTLRLTKRPFLNLRWG